MTPEEKKSILEELGGLPEDIYDSLVVKFLESVKEYVGQLRQCLQKGDYDQIKRLGHTVKGSGANLRLAGLNIIGKNIEDGGSQKLDQAVIEDHVNKLQEEVSRLEQFFKSA